MSQCHYLKFLKEVAHFRLEVFQDRLYPQYERLRDCGRVDVDSTFEKWATEVLSHGSGYKDREDDAEP